MAKKREPPDPAFSILWLVAYEQLSQQREAVPSLEAVKLRVVWLERQAFAGAARILRQQDSRNTRSEIHPAPRSELYWAQLGAKVARALHRGEHP